MKFAPIVIFVYNRPDHTEKALESLLRNKEIFESKIFIYSDGANLKTNSSSIVKTRNVVKNKLEGLSYTLVERQSNYGLARNVQEGVSEVLNKYGKVIVLEDDLLVSPLFLSFMNKCLEVYESHSNIYSINAYMHPIQYETNEIFLSPLATSSWGWATWKDKWSVFSMETPDKEIVQSNSFIKSSFNVGDLPYHEYLDNKTSWAIRWYYSVFIRNGLGVFPTRSLVRNIGFDGSGTNCGDGKSDKTVFAKALPNIVELETINIKNEAMLQDYFAGKNSVKGIDKIVKKIKKYIKKIIKI